MTVTTNNKEIMNTGWHFGTPVYTIDKSEWLSSAIKTTDKFIKASEK